MELYFLATSSSHYLGIVHKRPLDSLAASVVHKENSTRTSPMIGYKKPNEV